MDNEKMVIITTREALHAEIQYAFDLKFKENKLLNFKDEKLTQTQAAKLAGISIPTLKKEIRAGKFKEYSLGSKRYLLKSEVLKALQS